MNRLHNDVIQTAGVAARRYGILIIFHLAHVVFALALLPPNNYELGIMLPVIGMNIIVLSISVILYRRCRRGALGVGVVLSSALFCVVALVSIPHLMMLLPRLPIAAMLAFDSVYAIWAIVVLWSLSNMLGSRSGGQSMP